MSSVVESVRVFEFIFRQARHFPGITSIRFVCGVLWAVTMSLQPYLLKDIVNRLSECGGVNVFAVLLLPVGLYLLTTVIQSTGYLVQSYVSDMLMVPQVRKRIISGAAADLMQKSYRFFQNHFAGGLANRINDLMRAIPDIFDFFDRFFSHMLAFVIALYFLGAVSPFFAMLTALWAGIFFAGLYGFSGRLTQLSARYSAMGAEVTGHLVDFLTNMLSVRLFSAESTERRMLHSTLDRAVASERRLSLAYLKIWCFFDYSYCVLQALNFYLLCVGVEQGWLTVGDFALVLVLNGQVFSILYRLSRECSRFSKFYGQVLQALIVIQDTSDSLIDHSGNDQLVVTRGEITFEQVKFYYATGVSLFNEKSVVIHAGQKVGLVGYSGAGKSTFVNLILGLYEVQGGQILIDGQDIQAVTKSSLREAIAMIPQDPSLFHRSLMENIRYGLPSATDKAVIAAAKRAHAHDFIMQTEDGYDTLVGDRGVKLSGGQRQRIAIARAILKNAPILILDEATSQLDSNTETAIQESLWQLMQHKTSLVVAHRLSTLLNMDRILVFSNGTIVEDGSHRQLLKAGGRYKSLWDAQVGGFLPQQDDAGSNGSP